MAMTLTAPGQSATQANPDSSGLASQCPEGYPHEKWARMGDVSRKAVLSVHAALNPKPPEAKPEKAKREVNWAPPFSTDCAIAWGKRQGWTLLDRERYNHKTKRHADLQLGMDAMFESPTGLVMVQGAGRHEKREHLDRFMQRGGPEKARRRHLAIYYVEFERGNREPLLVECWVEGPALQPLLPV